MCNLMLEYVIVELCPFIFLLLTRCVSIKAYVWFTLHLCLIKAHELMVDPVSQLCTKYCLKVSLNLSLNCIIYC